MADNYQDKWFTTKDGLRLHYRDYDHAAEGAPMVLCMPGLTRNSRDFADIAAALSDEFRVIAMEFRGRGDSDPDPDPANYMPLTYAKDMLDFLATEKPTPIFALGTSLGGLVSMVMQSMAPSTFKGIILNDIGPEVAQAGVERIQGYVGKATAANWTEAIAATIDANAAVYPNFTDEDWDRFTRKLYVKVDGKPTAFYDPAIAVNLNSDDKERTTTPDLWPMFAALSDTPMHLLRGELSDILTIDILEKMQREHKGLTVLTVKDVGHVPLMDSDAQKQSILSFLRAQL